MKRILGWAMVLGCVATGCNSLSGADELAIGPEIDSDGAVGVTTGVGAGGASSAEASVTAATVGATSGAATSGASGSAASSGAGGGPVTEKPWPSGPYGVAEGGTVPEGFSWDGYPEQASSPGKIAIKDYFDPDGKKGIDALLIVTSQFNCGPCYEEAQALEGQVASWKQQGYDIRVLTLIIDDPNDGEANIGAAATWKDMFGLTNVAVAADPGYAFVPGSSVGTPQETVVDPRTMKVVSVIEGYSGAYPELEGIAAKNN